MLLLSGHSGYNTVTFGGHSAVIPGIPRRPASRPFPQCARRASHHWSMCQKVQGHVYSKESLGFSSVAAGSKMLFWWPNLGFSDSSLVCTCSCIGEAAICVAYVLTCLWGSRLPFRVSHSNTVVWSISGLTIPADY